MQRFAFLVNVQLKGHVRDPRGETIRRVLKEEKGLPVERLRIGKAILLEVEALSEEEARGVVERACSEMLVNPVVEDYEVLAL